MSSHTQKRKNALARYKSDKREGRRSSALDECVADNDDDDKIYDEVSEQEYASMVEARREREQFVVDDDGLGYYDDGEEHYGGEADDDDDQAKKHKKRSATAALTSHALKKARQNKKALQQQRGDKEEEDDENGTKKGGKRNGSMWDFVNRGVVCDDANSRSTGAISSSRRRASSSAATFGKKNVDDLLKQLDDDVALTAPTRRREPPRRRTFGGRTQGRSSFHRSARAVRATTTAYRQEEDHGDNDMPMMYDDGIDDHDPVQEFSSASPPIEDPIVQGDDSPTDTPLAPAATTKSASDEDLDTSSSSKRVRFAPNEDSQAPVAEKGGARDATGKETLAEASAETTTTTEDVAAPTRRRTRKNRLGQLSASAQKAEEQEAQAASKLKPPPLTVSAQPAAVTSTMMGAVPPGISQIASAGSGDMGGSGANKVSLDQVLVTQVLVTPKPLEKVPSEGKEENPEDAKAALPYVDLFFMDIAERNGEILLFGKVRHNQEFVSALLVVGGNKRNLFVLPKPDAEMTAVHQEVNDLLRSQNIIPRVAGASWAGKVVQRRYAFDNPDIPRGDNAPTDYLKVVYDAKYAPPSVDACQAGGKHFSKILNAGASHIETFLLKRKLKGPSWIRILQPQPLRGSLSHCKLEMSVDTPKVIQPVADRRPPPPLVTLSLKLKTVVNPQTHKSEIVSVAALCHRHVTLESGGSDADHPRHQSVLNLIRPLFPQIPFPRDFQTESRAKMPQLRQEVSERALLSRLLLQIGQWDPDVLVGHNAWGYDLEVLLSRAAELKIAGLAWSKLGRRKRTDFVHKSSLSSRRDWYIADVVQGRLLCDTYLAAKELLLNETTYSLTHLAGKVLHTKRVEIEPVDIPAWFETGQTLVHLCQSTLVDAQLVQRLLFRLQVLPLSAQLTNIAGNLWSHTLRSNRAERTEYLLLHEFHAQKYLVPEKQRSGAKKSSSSNNKAKYSGGLVLEPKRGLYDSFILLLDFNSLYPSIIQEYNLCFTTIAEWPEFAANASDKEGGSEALPPLPDSSVPVGVLPRVIQNLVERRRTVKKLLKQEANSDKRAELDIRQQALKLTANSMYGCLGFSHSRFFAQPIAAMVTALGRETLQKTVDIAQNDIGLDVIYGDTDSIMINTRLNDAADIGKVHTLGERVKEAVNRLYRTLELEIDGVFRSMLLLQKKKYAAKTVARVEQGKIAEYGQELKGLDLVRRDWCVQSKETGRFVTEQILSGQDSETVVSNIYQHLEQVAEQMRQGKLPLEKYVITKGLSKHPRDYPDAKSQPHVLVAQTMLDNQRPVNTGDHIPYVITAPADEASEQDRNAKASAAERARHPEEVTRSQGALKPDVLWYLTQQILPPVARLCDPIEAISPQYLAEKLGLDSSHVLHRRQDHASAQEEELRLDYKPASLDADRFKNVEKLQLYCQACQASHEFPGMVRRLPNGTLVSGLVCPNEHCSRPALWGHTTHFECYGRLSNTASIWVHRLLQRYYQGTLRCNEPSCQLETRQVSVAGSLCLRQGCTGRLGPADLSERDVQVHLKYLETLFDMKYCQNELKCGVANPDDRRLDLTKEIPTHDQTVFSALHQHAAKVLESNAYNWISSSFWKGLFHKAKQ